MRFAHPRLSAWFQGGAVVLTPSALLAAVIQKQYAETQIARSQSAWHPAPAFSVTAWLQQSWRDLRYRFGLEIPALLSSVQEQQLWERVIEKTGLSLFDVAATAQTARGVSRSLAEWNVPTAHPAWADDQDAHTFLDWRNAVRQECRLKNWLATADLWTFVADNLSRMPLPVQVVFAGFEQPAPALQNLAGRLSAANVPVEFAESVAPSSAVQVLKCDTPEHELESAARWARASFENQPESSIALLVPDLRARRSAVEHALRNIFYPSSILQPLRGNSSSESIFHVHAGRPLQEHPVIAAALLILELADDNIPLTTASVLLRSPFLRGAESERALRAQADVRLRSLREVTITRRLLELNTAECTVFNSILHVIPRVLGSNAAETAECASWAAFIAALLKACGWPGDIQLAPLEQAATEQWRDVLSTFGSLGLTRGPISWPHARLLLRRLASIDGPVSGDLRSPIQAIDPADAGSIHFDRAWTVGLADGIWPALSAGPAFIPPSLQRLCRMPSTAENRARQLTDSGRSVQNSADFVFGSFSGEIGREARLSRGISDFIMRNPDEIAAWAGKPLVERITPALLEEVDDTRGPVFQVNGAASGGSYLIKNQSICPFKAFAETRLYGREWDEGIFAFDQRDRGTFIHNALAIFWREVKTSERLHSLSDSELADLINNAADQALAKEPEMTTFRQQLKGVERERISRVIERWLGFDKKRKTPFSVLEVEAKRDITLSGLPVSLRIDRIDQLDSGGLIIIDYKSGNPDRKDLDGERPNEPQLLVYATALGRDVKGIYFGKLQGRNEGAVGYGSAPHFGDKKELLQGDWQQQLVRWEDTVTALARDFVRGEALAVADADTCRYCAIRPVCRIEEANRRTSAGQED